jgi:leucyl-tRNA synthetase
VRWKYCAYEIVREAGSDAAIVGEIVADESIDGDDDAVADYVEDLAAESAGLETIVDGHREPDVLTHAAWLFEDEFGAEVEIRRAESDDDLAKKARPNKPAIHIS